jgi:hypothetical protein
MAARRTSCCRAGAALLGDVGTVVRARGLVGAVTAVAGGAGARGGFAGTTSTGSPAAAQTIYRAGPGLKIGTLVPKRLAGLLDLVDGARPLRTF